MAHHTAAYTFEARWGTEVLDAGLTTIPTVVVKHMGELGLTNAEFALVVQAFSFKWSGENPYPSAATLAQRMGTTKETVWQITHRLREKGYLRRECIDQKRGLWAWDFGGLLYKALQLERGHSAAAPDPERTMDRDEAPADGRRAGALASAKGGTLASTKGGALAIAQAETEAVPESEALETEAASDPSLSDPSLEASREGEMQSLGVLLRSASVWSSVLSGSAVSEPEDTAPVVIQTLMDLMQWSRQVGYRHISTEVSRYGVERVMALAVLVERLWRQREVRDRARYLNWMIHHRGR